MNKKFVLIGLIIFIQIAIFSASVFIGEAPFFGIGGFISCSYINYISCGISFLLLIGELFAEIKFKKSMKSLAVVACFSMLFSFAVGSFKYIFSDLFDYSNDIVFEACEVMNIYIPKSIKSVTTKWDDYYETTSRVYNTNDLIKFLDQFNTPVWKTNISNDIYNAIPSFVKNSISNDDYFLFYDIENNEYNKVFQQDNGNSYYFVTYYVKTNKLLLISNCTYIA